ncbi:Rhamnan synthesis F [Acidimicrobiia bacterium]
MSDRRSDFPRYVGSVDDWEPVIRGWVFDESDPTRQCAISIFVDDFEVAQTTADVPRSDVKQSGLTSLNCGFVFDVSGFLSDIHVIRIVDTDSEIEIFAGDVRAPGSPLVPMMHQGRIGASSIRGQIGDEHRLERRVRESRSLAIISTYRPAGSPTTSIENLVESFTTESVPVVLVDTSPIEPSSSIGSDLLYWRSNYGWDFASWFAAIETLNHLLPDVDRLYLVNDSCAGPFHGLSQLLDRGWGLGTDMWSITDSWQVAFHLQSYFLAFGRRAIESGVLRDFIDAYRYPLLKKHIIAFGEIALTRHFLTRGFSASAVFSYNSLVSKFHDDFEKRLEVIMTDPVVVSARRWNPNYLPPDARSLLKRLSTIRSGKALNPSHEFWEELVDSGSPFLKRELLVDDPAGVADALGIGRFLARINDVDSVSALADDLRNRQVRRWIPIDPIESSEVRAENV